MCGERGDTRRRPARTRRTGRRTRRGSDLEGPGLEALLDLLEEPAGVLERVHLAMQDGASALHAAVVAAAEDRDLGALDRFPDDACRKLGRGNVLEASAVITDCRAYTAQDDNFSLERIAILVTRLVQHGHTGIHHSLLRGDRRPWPHSCRDAHST